MELVGEQIIGAPRQQVWDALNNPSILSRCIPGCEELTKVSDAETHAHVALKIGPVRARFIGKIFMTDTEVPSKCTLKFEGAGGAAGFARGSSMVTLSDDNGATRLNYSVKAAVGGKLGQVGGRLIDITAKKMADEFFRAFHDAMAGSNHSAAPAGPSSESEQSLPDNTGSAAATEPVRAQAATRSSNSTLRPHLSRALWFVLGAIVALAVSHWLS